MIDKNKILEKLHQIRTKIIPKTQKPEYDEYEMNKEIWELETNIINHHINKNLYKTKNEILAELNDLIGHPFKLTLNSKNVFTRRTTRGKPHTYLTHLKDENNINKLLKETNKVMKKQEKIYKKNMRKKIKAIKKIMKIDQEHLKDLDSENRRAIIVALKEGKDLEEEFKQNSAKKL